MAVFHPIIDDADFEHWVSAKVLHSEGFFLFVII